jgi:sugar phosphate isomerase/epimerase
MKIGMVSDSLAHLSFEDMLDTAARLGIEGIEVNAGNWSSAPHLDMAVLLERSEARRVFLKAFIDRGLTLVALNANGNQLHPTDGERQSQVLYNTIRLAGMLGINEVCLMSGLPAGGPGDRLPNWVVSSWPRFITFMPRIPLSTNLNVRRRVCWRMGPRRIFRLAPGAILRLATATARDGGATFVIVCT